MNPTFLTYLGFFVAVVIIIWAALEFRSRITRLSDRESRRGDIWVKLDPKLGPSLPDESPPVSSEERDEAQEPDEEPEQDMHTRARQNGHSSGMKHPL